MTDIPPPQHNLSEEQVSAIRTKIAQGARSPAEIAQDLSLPEDRVRIVIQEHNRTFRKR